MAIPAGAKEVESIERRMFEVTLPEVQAAEVEYNDGESRNPTKRPEPGSPRYFASARVVFATQPDCVRT